MKGLLRLLTTIGAFVTPVLAVPLMVSNMKGFQSTPVVDVTGMPLDNFDPVIVVVGTFASAPAAALSPTGAIGAGQWASLLGEFTAYGPQRTLTEPRPPLNMFGVFDFQHDGVVTGTPLEGKPVYVVLAKGASLATADAVCILRTAATFQAADDENPLPKRVGVGTSLGTTVIAGSSSAYMASASNLDPQLGPAYSLLELGSAPEMAVEVPVVGDLTDGSSEVDYGYVTVGYHADLTFTIRNSGDDDLHLTGTPRVAISGTGASRFAVEGEPAAVIPAGGQTSFMVRFTPVPGPVVHASLSIANDDSDENPFDIALTGGGAWSEIVVESPAGVELLDGTATLTFPPVKSGGSATPQTVTVRNLGSALLTNLGVTVEGDGFTRDASSLPVMLPPGGSGSFEVNFVPAGSGSGNQSATIRISNSDYDEAPFEIHVEGLALSPSQDTDADGLNDWAEYRYAALGFDWLVAQSSLVETLQAGANDAGLYSPSQVHALHVGTPLLARNPLTGEFTLTLGVEKSIDLQTFTVFPISAPQISVNGQGKLEFRFAVPEPAAFFRIEAE